MAAELTHENLPRDLGLLLHIDVGEQVVEEHKADGIGGQIDGEIGLVRVLLDEHGVGLQRAVHVQRVRVGVEGLIVLEHGLVALERTLGDAVVGYERAGVERVRVEGVGARLALAIAVVVVSVGVVVDPVVGAVAALGGELLVAEEHAGVARVRVLLVLGHFVEERRVRQRLDLLVLLANRALAVDEGPLVELVVEVAECADAQRKARRDAERHGRLVERKLGGVGDEDVVAALGGLGGEGVGQAGVELEYERVVEAGEARLQLGDLLARVVEARVELEAVEIVGVEEVAEVAGVARVARVRAADELAVQVAHELLLGPGEVRAAFVLHVALEVKEVLVGHRVPRRRRDQVGLLQPLDVVFGVHGVHVAEGDGRIGGLDLGDHAEAGVHLELEVVEEAVHDQVGAEGRRDDEHAEPEELEEDQIGADDVGQAVHLDVLDDAMHALLQVMLIVADIAAAATHYVFFFSLSLYKYN